MLHKAEMEMLYGVREVLPYDAELGVEDTNVIFLPGKNQRKEGYDKALGTLGVLGLQATVTDMPEELWHETERRFHQCLSDIMQHVPQEHAHRMFDQDMLSYTMQPMFQQLEAESMRVSFPKCEKLIMVGCEDGAWVLQAFLCELNRLGLKPHLDITVVALGSKSDSVLARAITTVFPERLDAVRYLSVHASLPARAVSALELSELESRWNLDAAPGSEGRPDIVTAEVVSPAGSEVVPAGNGLDNVDAADDLMSSDWYDDAHSAIPEVMASCLTSIDGMTEECIMTYESEESGAEAWYSAPATIVRWIVKCVL
jgi:hypothetical protein